MLQRTYTVTDIFNKATNWYFNLKPLQQFVVLAGVVIVLAELAPKTNYLNYIQPIPNLIPRKDFSESTKNYILARQGNVCNICKNPSKFYDFHHIGRRDVNSASNGEALCLECHAEKTRKSKKLFVSLGKTEKNY